MSGMCRVRGDKRAVQSAAVVGCELPAAHTPYQSPPSGFLVEFWPLLLQIVAVRIRASQPALIRLCCAPFDVSVCGGQLHLFAWKRELKQTRRRGGRGGWQEAPGQYLLYVGGFGVTEQP